METKKKWKLPFGREVVRAVVLRVMPYEWKHQVSVQTSIVGLIIIQPTVGILDFVIISTYSSYSEEWPESESVAKQSNTTIDVVTGNKGPQEQRQFSKGSGSLRKDGANEGQQKAKGDW